MTQEENDESHAKVALRMVGHEVLLASGDSTSVVKPIIRNENTYTISFESVFEFEQGNLTNTVDRIVLESKIASEYRVEVFSCFSDEVVYSFESSLMPDESFTACVGRPMEKDCYYINFTILAPFLQTEAAQNAQLVSDGGKDFSMLYTMMIFLIVLMALTAVWWVQKKGAESQLNLIPVGSYQFDQHGMELHMGEDRAELSSKESDLLTYLIAHQNETLEREEILNAVWGDEGAYVGRTLDVFISKLRKRLEEDPNIKIMNVRGVGYKLVISSN